ncbi:expressed unknown protein [Ectocarpus siliculosus]|uniref:Uncharacterized protein n=1 Tax=Ectocarpus siliculosus TaxID=2880 RepID=D7G5V0_ECTSI|nr:expressed unknown protein [Ectocarpus siliculosus]|eukprot:CBJ33894.1 expressed unknown protein [Ectocarpus siliculosus]
MASTRGDRWKQQYPRLQRRLNPYDCDTATDDNDVRDGTRNGSSKGTVETVADDLKSL